LLTIPETELLYKHASCGHSLLQLRIVITSVFTESGHKLVRRVEFGQANHGFFEHLEGLSIEECALSCLLEGVAAAHVPPAIYILILLRKVSEDDDGVLERLGAERSAFELALLNIDMVIWRWIIVLIGDHGEEGD